MNHPETIGAYRILEFLGEGGMGLVFRAEHRTSSIAKRQGPVVVKTLHPHLARKPEFRQRFEQEAEVGAGIEHPGVVRYLTLVEDRDMLALVMAYVPGKGLDELLEEYREPEVFFPLLTDLAGTLDHLHGLSEPVVHRDLKPSNIRITPEGKAIILDFGIARAGASKMTHTSTAMGTPDYMAPEQELDAKRVDGRADVYALGVIAFRLITGGLPWPEGLSWSAVFIRKAGGVLELDGAGDAVGVFRQVLAPRTEDRFVKASAFVNALGLATGAVRPTQPPAPSVLQEGWRREPLPRRTHERGHRLGFSALSVGVGFFLVTGLGVIAWLGLTDNPGPYRSDEEARPGAQAQSVETVETAVRVEPEEVDAAVTGPVRPAASPEPTVPSRGSPAKTGAKARPAERAEEGEAPSVDTTAGTAEQTTAVLWVFTDPPGADVRIDGTLVGAAPVASEVGVGTHSVSAVLWGRTYETQSVEVGPSERARIRLTPTEALVRVYGQELGPHVFVDGESVGNLPLTIPLGMGEHTFRVIPRKGPAYEVTRIVTADTTELEI